MIPAASNPFQVDRQSYACSRELPGRKISCSSEAGWSSLLIEGFDTPTAVERCEHPPTPDQLIVVVSKGACEVESRSGNRWRKAHYWPGAGGMTAAGSYAPSLLRWRAANRTTVETGYETLHLYVPAGFFQDAAERWSTSGSTKRVRFPDALGFFDPLILQTALSLQRAARLGASNLYAETAAQFVATHLLAIHTQIGRSQKRCGSEKLLERRAQRVCAFMAAHYHRDLCLDELAREAGISKFHFVGSFKQQIGLAPHQYLLRVRMRAAADLLSHSDLPIKAVAAECGYASPTTFGFAFSRYQGCTPTQYRAAQRQRSCAEDADR